MNFTLIHLSDFHCSQNQPINNCQVNAFFQIIENLKFDNIALLITGDITQSGLASEMKLFKTFIHQLLQSLKKVKDMYIPLIIVAGNHDFIANGQRNRMIIKNQNPYMFEKEISKFDNFYEYFGEHYKNDKYLGVFSWKLDGDQVVNFYMINSSVFSTFKDINQDNCQGTLMLPKNTMLALENIGKENFNILLSHYDFSYFEPNQRQQLEKIQLNRFNYAFWGHEHSSKHTNSTIGRLSNFSSTGISWINGFSIFNFRTDLQNVEILTYEYDNERLRYNRSSPKQINLQKPEYRLSEMFQKEVLFKDRDGELLDFHNFIFIGANKIKGKKRENINDYDFFLKSVIASQVTLIQGNQLYGKTTLAKKLFFDLQKSRYGLYFDCDKFRTINFSHDIRQQFFQTYDENQLDFSSYQNEDFKKKFIIFDNFDGISNIDYAKFIQSLIESFGTVIILFTNRDKINFKNEFFLRIEKEDNSIVEFELKKCTHKVRVDLIKSMCDKKNASVSISDITRLSEKFIDFATILDLNPFYVNMIAEQVIIHKISSDNILNVFGNMLETNIKSKINKHLTNHEYLDSFLKTLNLIACEIFKHKSITISLNTLFQVYAYLESNHDIKINHNNFTKCCYGANILFENENGIGFNDNLFLSYFLAKWIFENYKLDLASKMMEYLLENLIYGINSNVLLMLGYLKCDPDIIGQIIVAAELHFETITLNENYLSNSLFIEKTPKSSNILTEKELYTDNTEKRKNDLSRIEEDNTVYHVTDVFSNNSLLEPWQIRLYKGLKYLDIISRILPSYKQILTMPYQNIITENLYVMPNKLIHLYVDEITKFLSEYNNEITNFIIQKFSYSKQKADNMFSQLNIALILTFIDGIYTNIASNSINTLTRKGITNFPSGESEIMRLQKLYFESELDYFESMIVELEFTQEKSTNKYIKELGLFCFKNYLERYSSQLNPNRMSRVEKLFPNIKKGPTLLINK